MPDINGAAMHWRIRSIASRNRGGGEARDEQRPNLTFLASQVRLFERSYQFEVVHGVEIAELDRPEVDFAYGILEPASDFCTK